MFYPIILLDIGCWKADRLRYLSFRKSEDQSDDNEKDSEEVDNTTVEGINGNIGVLRSMDR